MSGEKWYFSKRVSYETKINGYRDWTEQEIKDKIAKIEDVIWSAPDQFKLNETEVDTMYRQLHRLAGRRNKLLRELKERGQTPFVMLK